MTEEEWKSIHMAAREEAGDMIRTHLQFCPFAALKIEERLRLQEQRFIALIGFMFGSGLLGGATGAALFKVLKG